MNAMTDDLISLAQQRLEAAAAEEDAVQRLGLLTLASAVVEIAVDRAQVAADLQLARQRPKRAREAAKP